MAGSVRGFVKLHRQFSDHPLWKESRTFSRAEAWLDIVFSRARGTSTDTLKRGEFQSSAGELAQAWQWGEKKVRLFLQYLVDEEMITPVASERGRGARATFAVLNYDKFNGEVKTAKTPTKRQKDDFRGEVQDDFISQIPLDLTAVEGEVQDDFRGEVCGAIRKKEGFKESSKEGFIYASSLSNIPQIEKADAAESIPPADPVEVKPAVAEVLVRKVATLYSVPDDLARAAVCLATIRHTVAKPDETIRSAQFFATAVDEVRAQWPLPAHYQRYLEKKVIEARAWRDRPG